MWWSIWPAETALKPDPGVDKYNCWDIWYWTANIASDPRERCCKSSVGMSIINIYDCNKYKKLGVHFALLASLGWGHSQGNLFL